MEPNPTKLILPGLLGEKERTPENSGPCTKEGKVKKKRWEPKGGTTTQPKKGGHAGKNALQRRFRPPRIHQNFEYLRGKVI